MIETAKLDALKAAMRTSLASTFTGDTERPFYDPAAIVFEVVEGARAAALGKTLIVRAWLTQADRDDDPDEGNMEIALIPAPANAIDGGEIESAVREAEANAARL